MVNGTHLAGHASAGHEERVPEMTGRVCVITGCTSGIGKATAIGLAKMGSTVVMVCRDQMKGQIALDEVRTKGGSGDVHLLLADLSSQTSVRKLADNFQGSFDRLHVLVNNAGVYRMAYSVTADEIETTFAVNHLAYFLLTNLLLEKLRKSAPSRIVNVSSAAHEGGSLPVKPLEKGHYSGSTAYDQSKLANVLFTYELARRLKNTGVTVNCLHPGVVRTNLLKSGSPLLGSLFGLAGPFLLKPEEGARTSIYLASSPEVEDVTGKYFVKNVPVRSSRESYDERAATELWELSTKLTDLD